MGLAALAAVVMIEIDAMVIASPLRFSRRGLTQARLCYILIPEIDSA